MSLPPKAAQPTLYFIGVTTTQSSIMKLFPLWARELGLKDAAIKGIDIEIHADPQIYRDCIQFIKDDPLSLGALVTTHKIDLYNAGKDLFEYLDPYAAMFDEISSISKNEGRLEGYAKDPISSGLSLEAFIPDNFWNDYNGEIFIMGAGGSALAISSHLTDKKHGDNVPSKIIISNRSEPRLLSAEKLLGQIDTSVEFEYHLCPDPADNDAILKRLKPYSLVINATGLGKDRPGSPLTDTCEFPQNGVVWELNYRGELDFMHQALKQKDMKKLHVEDGWIYFIHGWTQVIAEVFHTGIKGEIFDRLEKTTMDLRTAKN
ncbi:shikimate dehydrogenase family protein [Paenibacillus radicis (ex Xue et al. 2023)]|uniref:Shikimate dehydrogenase n=1 Tax=Paenibacillus radicis (ex Xue et al. 2023) TaxID=2972489 RepID=A0ABT1YIN9_9BACL|nr:shikimate dehydrogenase [Paenibacillus radicis (ex Xue et al. 2023)]MCR8633049.1 shikimate dehydrogenase [Paenibacillus radicis (ex Xue et al. 2023)]